MIGGMSMMKDLIDRQEAIKALGERPIVWAGSDYGFGARNQYDKDLLAIETVPSVHPNGPDNLVKDSPGLVKDLVNDCISRKAAIDALGKDPGFKVRLFGKSYDEGRSDQWFRDVYKLTTVPSAQPYTDEEILRIQELEQAQFDKMYELGYQAGRAAQPERQKGEWIDYTEDGYVECPFCHNATNCDGNKDELHFCFSCGADMREDEQK